MVKVGDNPLLHNVIDAGAGTGFVTWSYGAAAAGGVGASHAATCTIAANVRGGQKQPYFLNGPPAAA